METVFKEMHKVCIRDWRESDIPAYADLVGDSRVMKFIGNGNIRDQTMAAQEIARFKSEIRQQGWSRWAVSLNADGPMLGYVGFCQKADGIDIGLRFLHQYWNTPYPYVSTCLALEYGFEDIGFKSVYAMNHVDHRHAFGFTRKILNLEPRKVSTELGLFNVFDIQQDYYLNEQRECNRRKAEMYCRRLPKMNHCVLGP